VVSNIRIRSLSVPDGLEAWPLMFSGPRNEPAPDGTDRRKTGVCRREETGHQFVRL
jgi:hypothetical protein